MEQLNSLTKQISALTRLVSTVDEWKLEVMLSDEKYKGAVRIFSDKMSDVQYLVADNHPAIITEEVFVAVQKVKTDRSNVVIDKNGHQVMKSTKYSSKKISK